MTTDPERDPLKGFNPIHDIKALTAQLDDEPSEDQHLGVLPLEWLAREYFQAPEIPDDDTRSIVITFLTGDSRPEAYHVLKCEPCLSGLVRFAELYSIQIPD